MTKIIAAAILLFSIGTAQAAEPKAVNFGQAGTGFLFFPTHASDAPAVLLLHDWSGLSERMQTEAQNFADRGYVVLLPDLFEGMHPTTPEAARALMMHEDGDAQRARLRSTLIDAVNYLAVRPSVDPDDIALVGFEIGATVALKAGLEGLRVDAVVAYEPRPGVLMSAETFKIDHLDIPVLTHFAQNQDQLYSIQSFNDRINAQSTDNKVYQYPIVDPGFSITTDGQYDAAATKLARKRTFDFLDKHL